MIGGASCVLGVGWKSAFAELFFFALGVPPAPNGVERRSFGASVQGSGKADEVGLGLGLELELGLSTGLVAEFLTAKILLEIVSTGEKSK